jgi:hypothetical protein
VPQSHHRAEQPGGSYMHIPVFLTGRGDDDAECYDNFLGTDSLREAIAALLQRTFMAGMQVWPSASHRCVSRHDPYATSPLLAIEPKAERRSNRPNGNGSWTHTLHSPYVQDQHHCVDSTAKADYLHKPRSDGLGMYFRL